MRLFQNKFLVLCSPVEDEEWEADSGYDSPGQESIELELQILCDPVVGHEGVQDPEGDVGEEEEGDQLAAGLGVLLAPGSADPATRLGHDQAYGQRSQRKEVKNRSNKETNVK